MNRRSFIGWLAALLHTIAAVAVAVPVIAFLADPLRRRSRAAAATFIRVSSLDALPRGRPVRVAVHAERRDSFIQYPRARVGEVWLMRTDRTDGTAAGLADTEPGDSPTVHAWQTICPHLGCGIDYAPQQRQFACPCHTSAFALDGSRLFGPSPRGMDRLDLRITDVDGRRWVEVRFEKFQTGVTERFLV